ncbi:MAG: hypothetical protein NC930_01210 [Candidatus Omnitrophica bacterium]|nr:hypothetical protein [Candidatus Omnitrophota bacterium]
MIISKIVKVLPSLVIIGLLVFGIFYLQKKLEETRILKEVIQRLSSDSRVAEVLVTKNELDESTGKIRTTLKFLEFDTEGRPLAPKYFTFEGNIIQFQSLVVRFDDRLVQAGDRLRGRSAYLFLKAFSLDSEPPQIFDITEAHQIPSGYKIPGIRSDFETRLWKEFWNYALSPSLRHQAGVKNAQIEAPGSLFVPGTIYLLKIEHDGGIRIDTEPVPEILKGEKL